MFLNPSYFIYMAPAFLIMLLTTWYVNSAYRTWGRVPSRSRMTGLDAARRLIAAGGLTDVQIEGVGGNLTDHYDPRRKVLSLSRGVADNASVASLTVAAHELGHAMQDQEGYFPLRFRAALVPMVNIGSYLGWILIMIGLVLNYAGLALGTNIAWLGVLTFAGGAVFALATLPVELNASARAKRLLADTGIISGADEQRGMNTVLNAAALTYVAALVTAMMQLLYYGSLVAGFGGRRRR